MHSHSSGIAKYYIGDKYPQKVYMVKNIRPPKNNSGYLVVLRPITKGIVIETDSCHITIELSLLHSKFTPIVDKDTIFKWDKILIEQNIETSNWLEHISVNIDLEDVKEEMVRHTSPPANVSVH